MKKIYSLLLLLYPRSYRAEYGSELQAVFGLSFDNALMLGRLQSMHLVLRELISLPWAIIQEHLRERRKAKMIGKFSSRFDYAPGSRKEILAAVAPFLLFGAVPILISLSGRFITITRPYILEEALSICMLVSVISLLVAGFFRNVPRWFMPYLGLPLPLLSLLIFGYWVDKSGSFPLTNLSSQFLRTFVRDGFLWGIFIPLLVLLVVFSAAIPRYRPFYQRLRNDWTLLCFLLYGAAPFMAFFQFEGYQNYELYVGWMFLILAAGGWLYLRNDSPWKKFIILISGVTLSMFAAALGQAVLYESSLYNSHRPFPDHPWWATVNETVIAWMWLVLIMFLPLAITLLPRPKSTLQANEPVTV